MTTKTDNKKVQVGTQMIALLGTFQVGFDMMREQNRELSLELTRVKKILNRLHPGKDFLRKKEVVKAEKLARRAERNAQRKQMMQGRKGSAVNATNR